VIEINFKKHKAFLLILNLGLTIFASPSWALSVRCAEAIIGTNLNDIDPYQFKKALVWFNEFAKEDSRRDQLPLGFFKLASSQKMTPEALNQKMEEFYVSYRKNSHYLEEFKTLEEQKTSPWITRHHSHYLWLVTQLLKPGSTSSSVEGILNEMALVNKSILEHLNISNLSHTPIVKIDSAIKESVELRVAVYLELKLQDMPLTPANIFRTFQALRSAAIESIDWDFLNHIVLVNKGQVSYREALEKLNDIRKNLNQEKMLTGYEKAIYDITKTQNLTVKQTLSLFQQVKNYWVITAEQNLNFPKPETHIILDFLRIATPKLSPKSLVQIIQLSENYLNLISRSFIPEHYRDSRNLLSLIYLAQLNRTGLSPNRSGALSMAPQYNQLLWQSSVEIYNIIFAEKVVVSWISEELFLDYLLRESSISY
jgi:hypothetical protein